MSAHIIGGASSTLWTTADDGTDISATLENTRNTATTQDTIVEGKVGGTSGGNPVFRLTIPSGKTWNITSDNNDTDVFDIRDGSTSRIKASALGVIVNSNGNPAVSAMDVRAYGISSNCWITVRSDDTAGQAGMLLNIASSNKSRIVHYGSTEGSTIFGITAADYSGFVAANTTHNGLLIGCQGADPVIFGATDLERVRIEPAGNVRIGTAAIATGATDGYLMTAACAGAPTGAASPPAGMVAWQYDSTNNKIYVRNGGTWRSTAALT